MFDIIKISFYPQCKHFAGMASNHLKVLSFAHYPYFKNRHIDKISSKKCIFVKNNT